ncbi:MAG TPA: hypothetical protein VK789_01665 [Bryobacteraceae bacterium]|jgi:hypothetical protein|nr:hypothetical protein [Bryobacteraceae bacterium]
MISDTSPGMARLSRCCRTLVLILAITAMLNMALASTSPAHLHLNSSSPNRCDLCFTAHTTTFETPAALLLYGPEIVGRTAPLVPFFGYQPCNNQHYSSRGPPSLFL